MENNSFYTGIKKASKFLLIFSFLSFCFSCEAQVKEYEIDKIEYMDDGSIYIIVNQDGKVGVIIETNETLSKVGSIKIKEGERYALNLERIEKNFRGKNDKYVLISETGKQYVIWRKEDNYPLLLYRALNLNKLQLTD